MMQNHYQILEVSENASLDVIHAAWKALMKKYHPEGSQPDGEKTRAVNLAHDVLEDPEQRRRYDLAVAQERAAEMRQRLDQAPFVNHGAYPAAYPPNILEVAAQRFAAHALETMMANDQTLAYLINIATGAGRRGRV